MKTFFQNLFGKNLSSICFFPFLFLIFVSIGITGCSKEEMITPEPDELNTSVQTKYLENQDHLMLIAVPYKSMEYSSDPEPNASCSINIGPRWGWSYIYVSMYYSWYNDFENIFSSYREYTDQNTGIYIYTDQYLGDYREEYTFEMTSDYPLKFLVDIEQVATEFSRFVYNFGNPHNWAFDYGNKLSYIYGGLSYCNYSGRFYPTIISNSIESIPDPYLWVSFIADMIEYCEEHSLPMEIHFNGEGLFDGKFYSFDNFVREELDSRNISPCYCQVYFNGTFIL